MAKRINSRQKGASAEREFARLLTAEGFSARRGVQYAGGADSPDIVCPCLPGVHWEVKRTERLRLAEAFSQATRDSGIGRVPIVAHRANAGVWMASLGMIDLLAILRESDFVVPGLEDAQ